STILSISLGEKRKQYAEKVLGNSLVLLLVIALLLTAAGFLLMEPLLRLTGASATIMPFAKAYMRVILLGTVFNALGFGMTHFIRAEGNPKMAMFTMLIGAVLNLVLDPVLIFVFDLGIAGAAWATVISQAVCAVWVMSYYFGKKSLCRIRAENLRLNPGIVRRIAVIGSAPFAMQFVSSIYNSLLNNQLQRYGGDLAVSAMGVIFGVAMLMLMPIFGLNQGMQPIIGYNFGAGQYQRVAHATRITILFASILASAGWLVTRFAPVLIIGMFSHDNAEFSLLTEKALRIFFLMFPLVGFQIIAGGYFQAVGKPKQATLLSLSRQLLFLVPLMYILPLRFGLEGVLSAAPTSDFLSSMLTAVFYFLELKRLRLHPAAVRP
ncbi:MAG: MATE family efflux transporter, partial [Spirochaetes bacterium]|nr:MATE family efflux transporter [Spirochaetota bacterium]MBU0955147.1 MATE family efflux transporter [Spirochaetota bacterium]